MQSLMASIYRSLNISLSFILETPALKSHGVLVFGRPRSRREMRNIIREVGDF